MLGAALVAAQERAENVLPGRGLTLHPVAKHLRVDQVILPIAPELDIVNLVDRALSAGIHSVGLAIDLESEHLHVAP